MAEQENPWAPVFDAGMAFQREVIESTRGVVESGLALQRAALRSTEQAVRATDPNLWMPREVTERTLSAWMGAAPGVAPETADRVSRELAATVDEANPWMGRPAREMRDATLRTMHEAEEFLEETGHATEQTFTEFGESMRRVTEDSRAAVVRATQAAREGSRSAAKAAGKAAKAEPKAARKGGSRKTQGKHGRGKK